MLGLRSYLAFINGSKISEQALSDVNTLVGLVKYPNAWKHDFNRFRNEILMKRLQKNVCHIFLFSNQKMLFL